MKSPTNINHNHLLQYQARNTQCDRNIINQIQQQQKQQELQQQQQQQNQMMQNAEKKNLTLSKIFGGNKKGQNKLETSLTSSTSPMVVTPNGLSAPVSENKKMRHPCIYCPKDYASRQTRKNHLTKCIQDMTSHRMQALTYFNLIDTPLYAFEERDVQLIKQKLHSQIIKWAQFERPTPKNTKLNISCFMEGCELVKKIEDVAIILKRVIDTVFGGEKTEL
eukprot:UN25626